VGEPRVLICLYDDPLLHVDIKFVTLEEFYSRIETPLILLDTDQQLGNVILRSEAKYPYPAHQWIEDRFWIWIHYVLLKIGRGEYFEALDFFGYIRSVVLGPLLHIKNGNLPKGVRKVESLLAPEDIELLKQTLPFYDKASLMKALENTVILYRQLRVILFARDVVLQELTEHRVMQYMEEIKDR
jgi:hypothetical protein